MSKRNWYLEAGVWWSRTNSPHISPFRIRSFRSQWLELLGHCFQLLLHLFINQASWNFYTLRCDSNLSNKIHIKEKLWKRTASKILIIFISSHFLHDPSSQANLKMSHTTMGKRFVEQLLIQRKHLQTIKTREIANVIYGRSSFKPAKRKYLSMDYKCLNMKNLV